MGGVKADFELLSAVAIRVNNFVNAADGENGSAGVPSCTRWRHVGIDLEGAGQIPLVPHEVHVAIVQDDSQAPRSLIRLTAAAMMPFL